MRTRGGQHLGENNDRCSSTIEIHHGIHPQLQLSAASEGIRGALCKNEGGKTSGGGRQAEFVTVSITLQKNLPGSSA